MKDGDERIDWRAISTPEFTKALRAPFNRKIKKYGVRVLEVVKQDFTSGGADRLWHEGISLDFGDE